MLECGDDRVDEFVEWQYPVVARGQVQLTQSTAEVLVPERVDLEFDHRVAGTVHSGLGHDIAQRRVQPPAVDSRPMAQSAVDIVLCDVRRGTEMVERSEGSGDLRDIAIPHRDGQLPRNVQAQVPDRFYGIGKPLRQLGCFPHFETGIPDRDVQQAFTRVTAFLQSYPDRTVIAVFECGRHPFSQFQSRVIDLVGRPVEHVVAELIPGL
ncbi:hypothetical protein ACWEPH_18470 [Nocardia beijingensis]